MPFDLRQLRYFIAVAEEENVGRAAVRLNISQSPLSRQIQHLEGRLGFALFERRKQRVRLSKAGRTFLTEARSLIAHADALDRRARRTAQGVSGTLSIGFVQGAAYAGDLQALTQAFRRRHPGVEIELARMRSGEQHAALGDGRLDIGFAYTPPDEALDLQSRLLSRDRFVLVGPHDHPALHGRSEADVAKLDSAPFIALPRQSNPAFRRALLRACAAIGFTPDIRYELTDEASMLALAAAGAGVTMVQRAALPLALPGLAAVDLPGFPLDVTIHLVWRRHDPEPLVRRFLEGFEDR